MDLSRARLLSICLWSLFAVSLASLKLRGNETDRLSLLELKANIIDPLGALNTWNKSMHFCEWQGVQCGPRHQRVTGLFINSSKLDGHLSPYIGNLSFLRSLDLKNNSFSHEIPEEIGHLSRLQILLMHNNSFNGTIPANLSHCFHLQHLNLNNNKLTGEIPPEIGSFLNLELLHIGSNNLHGEIPSSIANLSNTLKILSFRYNYLSGHIPSSLGRLKRVEFLSLVGNNLSGTIPPSIYNLSLIRGISVHTNNLHGELPAHLGHLVLPKLEEFLFYNNKFSGLMPDISNASSLFNFQISTNRIAGKVPMFTTLPNMKIFLIDANNLGRGRDDDLDFLASLINNTNLKVLSIDDNNFGGKVPKFFGNFSNDLRHVQFGRNRIKGSIPAEIGNLVNLAVLVFGYNQMTGPIPSSIGKLQKLYLLNFQNNNLSGTIPPSFGNLTSLNRLSLASNNLQGVLPPTLRECKNLAALSLSRNNLSGPIPIDVVSLLSLSLDLDLSQNIFTGSIPNELGQLMNLGGLDFSNNKLSGGCVVLEHLFLGKNSLQGKIPKSFGALKGLIVIDFSHNNLSGKIPTYLENFRSLQLADFSFNNLEGEMPTNGIFKNASAILVMGNSRLCGGVAELSLPKCHSKSINKHKQSSKLIALVVCGFVAILLSAMPALLIWKRKRKGKLEFNLQLGVSFLEVSYGDLLKATNGFCEANLIGIGSFGSVYKANIQTKKNPLTVAVKVLNLQASKALKSFVSECKVLGSIKHRNVVELLTACSSIDFQGNDFKALVYEFMINGSLEEWLHQRSSTQTPKHGRHLNFIQKINIAIDIANALDHLHNHSHVPIVHSDIKPSNILLDSDMVARVGDFGLARFLEDPSLLSSFDQSSSHEIRGSIGYIAPEYSIGGELSKFGDIYSYGILLLEMFTGKQPTDEMFEDNFNLHNFVKKSLPDRLSQIVDSALLIIQADQANESTASNREDSPIYKNKSVLETYYVEGNEMSINFWNCLNAILNIGVSCSEETPKNRMSINDVVKELQHIKKNHVEEQ